MSEPTKKASTRRNIFGAVLLALLGLIVYRALGRRAAVGEDTALANAVGASRTKMYRMNVKANDDWSTFDVAVNAGDIVNVKSAAGKWRIKKSCDLVGWHGHPADSCKTLLFDGRIVKEANRGALLWRPEGMEGKAIVAQVGQSPLQVDRAGRLQFRINDDDVTDNDGQLDLELAITERD